MSRSEPTKRQRALYNDVVHNSTHGSHLEFEEYKQSYVAEVEQSIDFAGQGHDFFIRVKADELIASCERQLGSLEGRSVPDVGCGLGLDSCSRVSEPAAPAQTGPSVATRSAPRGSRTSHARRPRVG